MGKIGDSPIPTEGAELKQTRTDLSVTATSFSVASVCALAMLAMVIYMFARPPTAMSTLSIVCMLGDRVTPVCVNKNGDGKQPRFTPPYCNA